ncbi:DUF3718 domain-containing protein [Thalassotalea sp. G2M2-11]|uniref:DUF3718 domain-containing protein n=1 Tax=Thalassotalea sp. G2M2-11 TaxID=2787627 RepID=UPI0019D112C2|nr:DUF3718 domain-containing protein [Thalassotalea sp. G2M2-11]
MKTISKIILSVVLTSGVALSSQAVELKAGDNSQLTKLCMTAVTGNRAATLNAIKATGYSHKFVIDNVKCNANDMITFVDQYGKNSEGMIRALERRGTHVSIRDIAMLARKYR